jgi:hypothetical protein
MTTRDEPQSGTMGNADALRLVMMGITEMVAPWHEWLAGEVAYFVGQGHTYEQANAMAAAEYVTLLGMKIENGATRPEAPE